MDIKKIFLIFIIGMFLISFTSSLDFDNVKDEVTTTFDNVTARENPLLNKYPAITITNAFGLGDKIFEGYISQHTETCGSSCSSTIKIKLEKDGVLVDDIIFKTILEDGEEVEQNIRNYQFYVHTEGEEIEVNDYELVCEKEGTTFLNGTKKDLLCSYEIVGKHKEPKSIWTKYNLEEVPAGIYTLKLEGEKRPDRNVDWRIKTNGEWLNEWALWGAENGLAGYWSFDETTGTNIKDNTTGSLHNGTLVNGLASAWLSGASCKVGGCLNLSAPVDYAYFGTSDSNGYDDWSNYGNDFAISFWVNQIDYEDNGIISKSLLKSNPSSYGQFDFVGNNNPIFDGNLIMRINKSGFTQNNTGIIPNNQWSFIVVQYNQSYLNMYINGVLNRSDVVTLNVLAEDSPILLAIYYDDTYMKGYGNFSIDELAYYNRTLTNRDIELLYNDGVGLSYGETANIILNSPSNNYISPTNLVTFNVTGTAVVGANLKNMSLWTNETGDWELKNSTSMNFLEEGLVNYYKFDDNDLNDNLSILNGTNGGTSNFTGLINSARYFENTETINFSTYPVPNAVTYSLWFNTNDTHGATATDGASIYTRGISDNKEVISLLDGEIRFWSNPQSGAVTKYTTNGANLQNDTWYHLVVTGDGETTSGEYSIFINGVNQTPLTESIGGANTTKISASVTSYLGEAISEYGFLGIIDEFGVWNKTLSESEIQVLYNSGSGRYPIGIKSHTQTWTRYITDTTLWSAQICDSDDVCYFSDSNRTLFMDTSSPTITITSPAILENYGVVGGNETLNVTITDSNLGSCWYNYNGTNISIAGCSSGISNSTNLTLISGDTNIIVYANDSVGNTNTTNYAWEYIVFETSSDYPINSTEGNTETFSVNTTWLNNTYNDINAYLNYNGTRQSIATRSSSGNTANFTYSLGIPSVDADTNVTFYWEFLLEGNYYNSDAETLTIYNVNLDDCSAYSNTLFNFTMFNEELNEQLNATGNNTLIDVDLIINVDGEELFSYSNTYSQENPALICSEVDLSSSTYSYDLVVGFSADDFVNEFYFVDSGNLNSTSVPTNISLMDLLSADSTSFLFNYYDEYGLKPSGTIVHVMRKYIGEGNFREVERSKADQNGDTIIHLVEEDVIYYFIITLEGVVQYTSDTYTALCQELPCRIDISASGETAEFEPEDYWDLIDGGSYTITSDRVTREVTLTYVLNESGTMNFTIYKYENDASYTSINTSTSTGTSGSITLKAPLVAGNTTFFVSVIKDDEFISSEWVDFTTKTKDRIGTTLAVFLGMLIVLTLGLMAVTEGVMTLVVVIFGIMISGFLGLTEVTIGNTGINILIYLILAGGILIYKIAGSRK